MSDDEFLTDEEFAAKVEADLAAAREESGPKPIRSGKRSYPVGTRGQYVYYLVQNYTAIWQRTRRVEVLTKKYELTEGEQQHLSLLLSSLDQRRQKRKAR